MRWLWRFNVNRLLRRYESSKKSIKARVLKLCTPVWEWLLNNPMEGISSSIIRSWFLFSWFFFFLKYWKFFPNYHRAYPLHRFKEKSIRTHHSKFEVIWIKIDWDRVVTVSRLDKMLFWGNLLKSFNFDFFRLLSEIFQYFGTHFRFFNLIFFIKSLT